MRAIFCCVAVLIATVTARAQDPAARNGAVVQLSLDGAIDRATTQSEEVQLARAALASADTQVTTARSAALPQLTLSGGYVRTFQSAFRSSFSAPTTTVRPDPSASIEERLRFLEENTGALALGSLGTLLSSGTALPLGRENAYSFTLDTQQLVYAGGRVVAGIELARQLRSSAEATSTGQIADLQLQVRAAYFRTLLAQELESIAEAALVQAESFLNQERLRKSAGYASDLDVLRAEVSFENLRPQLVAAQNQSQLAGLNLKRLINLPVASTMRLTTPLQIPTEQELGNERLDIRVDTRMRSTVEATERQVNAQAQNVRIARAAQRPAVSLQMSYGSQVFPTQMFGFSGAQWQPDWTATVGLQVPLFTGFETQAAIARAGVAVRQSQLQLAQIREAVTLEYEQATGEKARARSSIGARQRTVEQAQRVYDLTVLRYTQGQATQLEVSQARLELLQSRSNLAQSIADFYLADAGETTASGPIVSGAVNSAAVSALSNGQSSSGISGTSTTRSSTTTTTPASTGPTLTVR